MFVLSHRSRCDDSIVLETRNGAVILFTAERVVAQDGCRFYYVKRFCRIWFKIYTYLMELLFPALQSGCRFQELIKSDRKVMFLSRIFFFLVYLLSPFTIFLSSFLFLSLFYSYFSYFIARSFASILLHILSRCILRFSLGVYVCARTQSCTHAKKNTFTNLYIGLCNVSCQSNLWHQNKVVFALLVILLYITWDLYSLNFVLL